MKKTISTWMLTLVLVTGAFVSCSKNGDKPVDPNPGGGGRNPPPVSTYYMKMKIDGVQKNFPIAGAATSQEDGQFALVIGAAKDTISDQAEALTFVIASNINAITADSYVEGTHDNYSLLGFYAPQNATDEQIFDGSVKLTPTAPVKVTITQLTDKIVKGTFSGIYYDQEGNGTNQKVITDGEFTAQIVE